MCGKGSVEKMNVNWDKYVPKILKLEKGYVTPPKMTEAVHQKALLILDRKLRYGGLSAKSPAAFSIHEVYSYIASFSII